MELRAYGVGTTIFFPLIDKGATDFESTPVTIASGDCKVSQDGGSFANITSNSALFAHVAGGIYKCDLTATEMQGKQIVVKIVDQTGTKEWEDQCIIITTVNHASAEIPSIWSQPQSIAAGAITAASIASDAITAAKIADGAIDAATFASGAINAAAIASDAITAAKIADGAIDAATFAAGAINAAAIAADAITDAKVASDVTIASVTGAVGSVTGNVGGNVTGSVGSVAAGGITASSIATDALGALELASDAVSEIAAAVWDLATSGHVTAGTFGAQLKTLLDTIATYIDTEIAAIKAKTDLIPAAPAAVGDIPTATENAVALLQTDMADVEAAAPVHSLVSAILKLVSRFKASTGQTFRTNGSTVHMTQTPTTDPAADPITELGTAS